MADALGPTVNLWNEFIRWMKDEEESVTGQEWKGIVVKKYGWSLRLKQKEPQHRLPGSRGKMLHGVISSQ